jgi:L,D-peptidoglycan transpeptidase YkuD (ErfK/YbiS/YcfS/YnhG family)
MGIPAISPKDKTLSAGARLDKRYRPPSSRKKLRQSMEFYGTRNVFAKSAPSSPQRALIAFRGQVQRAALGRVGLRTLKREGDGATPIGRFPFRGVFWRADRIAKPPTRLPCRAIRVGDSWCDDPRHASYNRFVRRARDPGAEGLMRSDHLYDIVVVLGYNDRPRIGGKGSAIFMHLARDGYPPTDGCVALSKRDLLALLRQVTRKSALIVSR